MESDKLYEKETGRSAWVMYAHLAGPTAAFLDWIDKKIMARLNHKCEHIDNVGNCCKTVGHKKCTCKEQLAAIKKRN